ncbi:GNAT family N-acetyltransferase [Ornithinimicrobium sp. F0845]|uniref:GNAT family N-acetyltransferase n=1 Tax=Ornithinimicrobium sp. F0845 TaxID=2926412 RepID=UPI001FF687D1|nr:GNAT family N-acetyltransferase [Ornithinimicrobium sp. F0845]
MTSADLPHLEERWPVPGDVHAAHLRAQEHAAATFLVAWSGDEPLGSAKVQWGGPVGAAARDAYPEAVEVNHLQVREEHRGRGVGTAIIAAAEELCLARGRRQVAVGVGLENDGAARLYERLGYRRTGAVDTSEYDWVDADGTVHHEVEQDELLVRAL